MKNDEPTEFDQHDYADFLRYDDREDNERSRKDYLKSKRKGKFRRLIDARRRREFSPGRYWATSPAGVHLNREHVKGSAAYVLANHQYK